jgi:hypothetical protein
VAAPHRALDQSALIDTKPAPLPALQSALYDNQHSAPRSKRMRYKPKSVDALRIALGGLPNRMRVEVDPDIKVTAKTVGQLCKMTTWPENLVVATPPEVLPGSAVRVSKATVATRFSPKP